MCLAELIALPEGDYLVFFLLNEGAIYFCGFWVWRRSEVKSRCAILGAPAGRFQFISASCSFILFTSVVGFGSLFLFILSLRLCYFVRVCVCVRRFFSFPKKKKRFFLTRSPANDDQPAREIVRNLETCHCHHLWPPFMVPRRTSSQ